MGVAGRTLRVARGSRPGPVWVARRPDAGLDGSVTGGSAGLPRISVVLGSVASLVVAAAGVHFSAGIVAPVALAFILTVTVSPVGSTLRRHGLPGWAASVVLVLCTYLIVIGLMVATVLALGELNDVLPRYAARFDELVTEVATWLHGHGLSGTQLASPGASVDPTRIATLVGSALGGVAGLVGNIAFLGALLLFVGMDVGGWPRVLDGIRTQRPLLVGSWLGFASRTRTYLVVATGFGFVVAAVDAVALVLMGVPGAFAWGVLAFVTNFIPNVGFVVGLVPPALVALLEGGPPLMLAVIAVYCVVNLVIQSVIQPKVVGDAVALTSSLTFVSLVFWAWLIGPLGALLAVPLTLLCKALLVDADPRAQWAVPLLSGRASGLAAAPLARTRRRESGR